MQSRFRRSSSDDALHLRDIRIGTLSKTDFPIERTLGTSLFLLAEGHGSWDSIDVTCVRQQSSLSGFL